MGAWRRETREGVREGGRDWEPRRPSGIGPRKGSDPGDGHGPGRTSGPGV